MNAPNNVKPRTKTDYALEELKENIANQILAFTFTAKVTQ